MSCDISSDKSAEEIEVKENQKSKSTSSLNISQNKMVRTDSSEQKIDKFLNTSNSSMLIASKSNTEHVITR